MKKFAALLLLTAAAACAEGEFRTAQAMGAFSEGYAAFQNEQGLWGYIDRAAVWSLIRRGRWLIRSLRALRASAQPITITAISK